MIVLSGGEVDGHCFEGLRQSFLTIDLAHFDLAGGPPSPEYHRPGGSPSTPLTAGSCLSPL